MTTTQNAAHPGDYISTDTYTGRYSVVRTRPTADTFRASELAGLAPEGVLWTSAGHIGGGELFCRSRYVADTAGNLHLYASDGHKSIIHPAQRPLRVLVHR